MTIRFITIEQYGGEVTAYTENQEWRTALDDDNVADWIWQFADSPEQAVSQHYEKHDEWQADMEAGLEEKDTY